jgi:enamine deaminase RidA (YjgF/YER057c/UK114 family)
MSERINISSGAPWEDIVGYSRAVRIGNTIEVAGTTAVENGVVLCKNDAAGQTDIILKKISVALEQAGASLKDVVRTRIYVTQITQWEAIGRLHGSYFSAIKPATTMVEVSNLIDKDMLVEIEVTAIVQH